MLLLLGAAVLAGCSGGTASHDPVLVGESLRAANDDACDAVPGDRCVVVSAPVEGSREGEGSCRIYGPGDPDVLEPLARSGPLRLVPGETVEWHVALPGAVAIEDLNPVCQPMIEG